MTLAAQLESYKKKSKNPEPTRGSRGFHKTLKQYCSQGGWQGILGQGGALGAVTTKARACIVGCRGRAEFSCCKMGVLDGKGP